MLLTGNRRGRYKGMGDTQTTLGPLAVISPSQILSGSIPSEDLAVYNQFLSSYIPSRYDPPVDGNGLTMAQHYAMFAVNGLISNAPPGGTCPSGYQQLSNGVCAWVESVAESNQANAEQLAAVCDPSKYLNGALPGNCLPGGANNPIQASVPATQSVSTTPTGVPSTTIQSNNNAGINISTVPGSVTPNTGSDFLNGLEAVLSPSEWTAVLASGNVTEILGLISVPMAFALIMYMKGSRR